MRDFSFASSDRRLSFATSLYRGRESLHLAQYSPSVNNSPTDFLPMVDAFLATKNYGQLYDWDDSQWEILQRPDAVSLLAHLLSTDMAYSSTVREPTVCDVWAREFVGLFDRDALFVTNWNVYSNGEFALWKVGDDGCRSLSRGQWITDATFDSGLLGFDTRRIGMLWFTDED